MKIYRNTVYISSICCLLSLVICIVLNFYQNGSLPVNIFIGIFSSSFLVLISSIIGYNLEKKKELTNYSNTINCINLNLIPFYNLFKKNNTPDLDAIIRLININYEFLRNHVHMRLDSIQFLLPNSKMAKCINEIDDMIFELYEHIVLLNKEIWEIDFGVQMDANWYETSFNDFADYIRNYHEDDILTNILTQKHECFMELGKLKYKKTSKISLN